MDAATLDLGELSQDGDILKMDDGRALRLRVEVDQDASINDYDSDGRVEWVRGVRDWSPVRYPRPDGFDGRARILIRDNGSAMWWQPYESLTEAQIVEDAQRIVELVTFGFSGVIVEMLDGTDAYGRPIVANVASLWGISSLDNGYLSEVVSELVDELA